MKTTFKSERTVHVDRHKGKKVLHQKMNQKIADEFDFSTIFANTAPEDVIHTDDQGKVILDPNNPKHAEIRDRWLED